jgi:hypothetical protein
MEDIKENEDTHPDYYDPYSRENVELQRRIRELHGMLEDIEKKSAREYRKFKDSLERESDKDPRYAKLLEATSDLISKALLVRPDTSKLTKSFNRAYFEIMRHILRILINPPEKTTIPFVQSCRIGAVIYPRVAGHDSAPECSQIDPRRAEHDSASECRLMGPRAAVVQWDRDYKIRRVKELHVQATNMINTYYRTLDWINNKSQPDRNREVVHQLWNRHYLSKNELKKIIESENEQTLKNYCRYPAEYKEIRAEIEKLNREINEKKRKSEIAKYGDDYYYRLTGGTYDGYGPNSYCY